MSIPCGLSDGLPVGAMLIGKHWDESTIYAAAAAAFEDGGDWKTFLTSHLPSPADSFRGPTPSVRHQRRPGARNGWMRGTRPRMTKVDAYQLSRNWFQRRTR